MFSKEILKEDLITLSSLEKQLVNCKRLIQEAFIDLMYSDTNEDSLKKDTIFIHDLQDQYLDLEKEINTLQERIYLNFTNVWHMKTKSMRPSFPHINGYKNDD